ncbi:hypothetical protein ARAM_005443 [Aspergillus rambellii]|uniref:Uncharacterized protein n=1 Tax=Aspergillus rambellii TaxID=308745 RepID=A0A0F8WQC3_9EURO|nr:hypothetical protein ARAM_005443 [Aspergillus rambellii]
MSGPLHLDKCEHMHGAQPSSLTSRHAMENVDNQSRLTSDGLLSAIPEEHGSAQDALDNGPPRLHTVGIASNISSDQHPDSGPKKHFKGSQSKPGMDKDGQNQDRPLGPEKAAYKLAKSPETSVDKGEVVKHERIGSRSPAMGMEVDVLQAPAAAQSQFHHHHHHHHHHHTSSGEGNATGVIRPSKNISRSSNVPGLDGLGHRRSRSIGSSSRDSRIAALQLSLQLRARLSHAAARVEKRRQSHSIHLQSPTSMLKSNNPTSILSAAALAGLRRSALVEEIESQRLGNDSPNTTVSAPDPPATSSLCPLDAAVRLSPANLSNGASSEVDLQKNPQSSLSIGSIPSKLAPAADIVASRMGSQRRRPNPNAPSIASYHPPFSLHRRYHSQQELGMMRSASDSEAPFVPETPPLQPSVPNLSAAYNGISNPTKSSSSMEQDAIETLLFMSSPSHSGYKSTSQNPQPQLSLLPIGDYVPQSAKIKTPWGSKSPETASDSQSARKPLEAQAGDEIDRMLDQMDSDSDDEKEYTSTKSARLQTSTLKEPHAVPGP